MHPPSIFTHPHPFKNSCYETGFPEQPAPLRSILSITLIAPVFLSHSFIHTFPVNTILTVYVLLCLLLSNAWWWIILEFSTISSTQSSSNSHLSHGSPLSLANWELTAQCRQCLPHFVFMVIMYSSTKQDMRQRLNNHLKPILLIIIITKLF